jgi:PAS domain-containing protein
MINQDPFALTLIKPDGEILFENSLARSLFPHENPTRSTIFSRFSAPHIWNEILKKVKDNQAIIDEPVAMRTVHSEADVLYLTVTVQFSDEKTDLLCCIWSARQRAADSLSATSLSDYTRELEEVIEQRTFQQILVAEQNTQARTVLDALPVGILVVSDTGEVLYRNRSMSDVFGLNLHEYMEHNLRCFLPPEALETFAAVAKNGRRAHLRSTDPGGHPALVDILPLLSSSELPQFAFQFRRSSDNGGES